MILLLLSIPVAFILGMVAMMIVVEWQARKAKKQLAALNHSLVEWLNKHTNTTGEGPTELPK